MGLLKGPFSAVQLQQTWLVKRASIKPQAQTEVMEQKMLLAYFLPGSWLRCDAGTAVKTPEHLVK